MGGVGLDRVAAAVDLVLPRSCGACGVPSDESVCDRCLSRLVAGLFIGGPANQAGPGKYMLPAGIDVDEEDRIIIADTCKHRLQVYQRS